MRQVKIEQVTLNICGGIHSFDTSDTKDAVIAKLGQPQDFGGMTGKDKHPRIFLYDNIEFHFDDQDTLCLIFKDCQGLVELALPLNKALG